MTVTAGVLNNTVEILKLTLKSLIRLITHLLRSVALGVGTLHPRLGHIPTAKWVRLLSQRFGVGPLKETLIAAVSRPKLFSQRLRVGYPK